MLRVLFMKSINPVVKTDYLLEPNSFQMSYGISMNVKCLFLKRIEKKSLR